MCSSKPHPTEPAGLLPLSKPATTSRYFRRSFRHLPVAVFLFAPNAVAPAGAQIVDCDAYARSYADAHVSSGPSDLSVADAGMRGAVAGGAWEGPSGAARGAVAGGALSVLNSIGNYSGGWQGMYDLAYNTCINQQSPVNHRPTTLGDPNYHPSPSPLRREVPPFPASPRIPVMQSR